jgi:hypothetical protein
MILWRVFQRQPPRSPFVQLRDLKSPWRDRPCRAPTFSRAVSDAAGPIGPPERRPVGTQRTDARMDLREQEQSLPRFRSMEKTIVLVELPRDSETDLIVRDGLVFVLAPQPGRSGVYEDELETIAQFYADETMAKFEAKWIDDHWVIGKRFLDS